MPHDHDLDRLREIHRIVCEVVAVPSGERAQAVKDRCQRDPDLTSAVLRLIERVELEESSLDLGADFADRYELLSLIGRGGMGEVYRAVQKEHGRHVAVKKVRQDIGRYTSTSSFLREAMIAASINHPGITAVFDIGTLDGLPCFAMELVEGKSLDEAISNNALTSDVHAAAEIVADLADALAVAHQRGILHRDLKPSNVLLDDTGRPRITDFGIARPLGADDRIVNHSAAGTIGYIAPEQALGEPIDQTADIFSLGAILFALLMGKPPFVDSLPSTIESFAKLALNSTMPSLDFQNKCVDGELTAICHRCLHPNPSSRYQSAQQLATDLREWLRSQDRG